MIQPTKDPQASKTFTGAVTNFWKDDANSTWMKIVKFIGAIFGYLFALPLDAATKIAQLFGKDEKPTNKNWTQKIQDFASKGKDSVEKFASNHWGKTLIGGALVGAGIYFNVHDVARGFISKSSS